MVVVPNQWFQAPLFFPGRSPCNHSQIHGYPSSTESGTASPLTQKTSTQNLDFGRVAHQFSLLFSSGAKMCAALGCLRTPRTPHRCSTLKFAKLISRIPHLHFRCLACPAGSIPSLTLHYADRYALRGHQPAHRRARQGQGEIECGGGAYPPPCDLMPLLASLASSSGCEKVCEAPRNRGLREFSLPCVRLLAIVIRTYNRPDRPRALSTRVFTNCLRLLQGTRQVTRAAVEFYGPGVHWASPLALWPAQHPAVPWLLAFAP
jgi:hypothetical protein